MAFTEDNNLQIRKVHRANILGDLRAEADREMLEQAFFETPDYKTLIETSDRVVVVGRRGTGKSALVYRLEKLLESADRTIVVKVAPNEDQIIGIRPQIELFGDSFRLIRAGSRIIWKYALCMEIARKVCGHYKMRGTEGVQILRNRLVTWQPDHASVESKLRGTLQRVSSGASRPEDRIADLAKNLELSAIEEAIQICFKVTKYSCVVLVDRLDEGYLPDEIGIGFVDGMVQAAIDLKTRFEAIRPVLFLRDNIFRAVAKLDPDYSRNIEGHVLRLHWDEHQLLNLVANRLRVAFNLPLENSQRVWDRCTANDLQGKSGFRRCLQLTLYRPRDLLSLLNEAFYAAAKQSRKQIIAEDLELTAKQISHQRLDDLHKEYSVIFPGLSKFTSAFANGNPEITIGDASELVEILLSQDAHEPVVQRDLFILEKNQEAIRALYSVGFIGTHDVTSATYVFCHDGKNPNKEFNAGDKVLIHPCYWMALNLTRNTLKPEEAQEINDEYAIEVTSTEPQFRNVKLGKLISDLDRIPLGIEGADAFEEWCFQAIRTVFAGHLRNIELKPNKQATQRRDIVGTNLSESGVWKRIYDDYRARQVIFEVKNFKKIGRDEYRQVLSYLTGDYGRLAFVVTRDDNMDLQSGSELDWVREMYQHDRKILAVKLTAKFLTKLLSKLRSPGKHDEADARMHTLLDDYARLYVSGQGKSVKRRARKGK